jgi:hypothetical protein
MSFQFEYSHFAMDGREKVKMLKDLSLLQPDLLEIVISELQAGNIISSVENLSDNAMAVILRDAYHKSYEHPSLQHFIETDVHYQGDFYRLGNQSVVAAVL